MPDSAASLIFWWHGFPNCPAFWPEKFKVEERKLHELFMLYGRDRGP